MTLDGQIGSISISKVTVITGDHPAVVLSGEVEPDQGVLEPGTILARNASQKLVAWDGSGDPVGVLEGRCDTAAQATALYLAHGTVVEAVLLMADGDAPAAAEIFALAKAGVYGV